MARTNDDLLLKISTIKKGDRGHAKNVTMSWGELKDRLDSPKVDTKHTLPEYLDLPVDVQNKLKDVGSFVCGTFLNGIRQGVMLEGRSAVALDIDGATVEDIKFFKKKLSRLYQYEFFGSTTRKHTAEKPRWRLVFPLSRYIEPEEYNAISRILASHLFETEAASMDACDDVSYRPVQVMYWPSICKGGLFESIENTGEILDPDELLESFAGDWRDYTQLPFSEKRGMKRPSDEKAENPREKRGWIGAFCRVYDVPRAIEDFIPTIYAPGDPNSTLPRYTFLNGSASNGAVVYDDGDFLYSYHGTDPCGDKNVNSFDMVRLHKFGHLDADYDVENTNPVDLPSYGAMIKLCKNDEDVVAEYDTTEVFSRDLFSVYEDEEEDEEDAPEPPKKASKDTKKASKDTKKASSKREFIKYDDEDEDDSDDQVDDGEDRGRRSDIDLSFMENQLPDVTRFNPRHLGPFWSNVVRNWAEQSGAPIDFTAWTLITGAAGTIGMSREVVAKAGWSEPCILWTVLVGDPSTKKSPALGMLSKVLSELEKRWIPEHAEAMLEYERASRGAKLFRQKYDKELESFEGSLEDVPPMPAEAIEPVKPIQRRCSIADSTLEKMLRILGGNPRGLLLLRDELAAWFDNMSRYNTGSDRSTWLEAYGGRTYTIDRVKDDKPITVKHMAVSILGGIQPSRLNDFMKSTDDGMQARFVYVWPDHTVPKKTITLPSYYGLEGSPPFDHRALNGLTRLALIGAKDNDDPVRMPLSRDAFDAFHTWVARRERKETAFVVSNEHLLTAYGKSHGLVLRLALILELLWWADPYFGGGNEEPPEQVSLRAVEAAIAIREEYIVPMQRRTVKVAEAHAPDVVLAKSILAWIVRKDVDRFSLNDLVRSKDRPDGASSRADRPGGQRELMTSALSILVDAGAIQPSVDKKSKRGRPKSGFEVHPDLYEAYKAYK